jgi:hypothetical protein
MGLGAGGGGGFRQEPDRGNAHILQHLAFTQHRSVCGRNVQYNGVCLFRGGGAVRVW